MNPDVIGGAVRTVLATLGGIAITAGYLDQDQVGDIVVAGGAIASTIALVWSIVNKFMHRKAIVAASAAPNSASGV